MDFLTSPLLQLSLRIDSGFARDCCWGGGFGAEVPPLVGQEVVAKGDKSVNLAAEGMFF